MARRYLPPLNGLRAFEAAGQGVAILMYPMFLDHLETGRLVTPFGTATYVPITCYLLYAGQSLARDEVRAFRDWISGVARNDGRLGDLGGMDP